MAPPGGVGVHGATPSTVFATGEAALSKTPLFSGHFGGAIAALLRASHSSSRSAAARTAFFAHARFAMSLSRPPDSTERHAPAYLLSGTTRPKRRRPENNTQSAPSRRQISDAPRRTRSLSEILLRAEVRSFINNIGCYFL